jgi:hypothetical protein
MRNLKLSITATITSLLLLASCQGSDTPLDPTPTPPDPVPSNVTRFHCAKHNLTYEYVSSSGAVIKNAQMPCPVCDPTAYSTWMTTHALSVCGMQCPVDSTWTFFSQYDRITDYITRDHTPFVPIAPGDDVLRFQTMGNITVNSPKNSKIAPDCWCDSCWRKSCAKIYKEKKDSLDLIHNTINFKTGIDKHPFPINNGVPADMRVRARQILDSIEAIMPKLDWRYKKEYNELDKFVGGFNAAKQHYLYCKKSGTTMGSWVSKDTYSKVNKGEYISDTVVINIGGGPDYKIGGGNSIDLYKAKTSTKTRSSRSSTNVKSRYLVQGVQEAAEVQLSAAFSPDKVDFLADEYFPRKYNTATTSEFIIYHPQKGNEYYSNNTLGGNWAFVNFGATVGGWNNKFPNNIVSVETADLCNAIGVEEIRKVVEWCKARHKVITIMGTSWGGAMIMQYLLYYPASDFDYIFISDQNPNIPQRIIESDYDNWIYNNTTYGTNGINEVNPNLCVLSTSPYRRLNWLKNQNLSNTVFYYVDNDGTLGGIPTEDIATLKGLGASVYKFPESVAHGAFHKDNVWYRQVVPTKM